MSIVRSRYHLIHLVCVCWVVFHFFSFTRQEINDVKSCICPLQDLVAVLSTSTIVYNHASILTFALPVFVDWWRTMGERNISAPLIASSHPTSGSKNGADLEGVQDAFVIRDLGRTWQGWWGLIEVPPNIQTGQIISAFSLHAHMWAVVCVVR